MSETVINGKTYVIGLDRIPVPECEKKHAHLYLGTFNDPGQPMCADGWNRGGYYSIWRGSVGAGICKTCISRAEKGLEPVPPKAETVPA